MDIDKNKPRRKKNAPVVDFSQITNALETFLQWKRPKLDVVPSEEIYQILKRLRPPIIVQILVLTIGTIGYMAIDNYETLDALYMTVITIATVGFGEISQTSASGRIFTMLLIFSGIGSFGYSTGVIVSLLSDGTFLKLIKERIMIKNIGLLENHFIICGFNETSQEIIRQLHKKRIPFVVIDEGTDFMKKVQSFKIEHYVEGSPFGDDSLRKAHISTCKRVIATSPKDNDNFAIVLSARILLEKLNNTHAIIISLARNNENKEKLLKVGASHVLTPQIIAGQRLVTYALKPETFYFMNEIVYSDRTDVDIEELHIYNSCELTGKALKDTDIRTSGLTVLAIKKGKNIITPVTSNDVFEKDDTIIVMGKSTDIRYYLKKYTQCFSETITDTIADKMTGE